MPYDRAPCGNKEYSILFYILFYSILFYSILFYSILFYSYALFASERYLSHCMGKPTICIGENKGADQLRSHCEADQRLCFRYTDSTIFLLSIKSKNFRLYLIFCDYSLVCVRPGRNPNCWFSHAQAHFTFNDFLS